MAGITGQFDDCDDAPREVDLLTEEHVEDLLDAVECLRGKVEQLQVQCEKLMYEKGQVEDQLIQQEKDLLDKETYYEKELSALRKINTELTAQLESRQVVDTNEIPSWAKTSLDAELAVNDKLEAEQEVKSLQIVLREKDKQISNLEWQVMDAESTVTSIQAERDKLAVELDCMLAREEENLESYQDYSDDRNVFSDDEYDNTKLQHSHKKHARRHLSDLTRRDDSHIDDFTDFVRNGGHVTTLSNNDVPSAADAEFLGGLKRTTNFSNINNMDESTDFHQNDAQGHDSLDLSASYPSTMLKSLTSNSNWYSFGSDSDSGVLPSKTNQSEAWDLCDLPSSQPPNEGTYEEGCFDDANDWALDSQPAPLGSLVNCKNGSCRSSSSAYFSDNSTGHDPWTFTPDSIIDVSTGEEIKQTLSGSKNSLGSDNETNNLQSVKTDISKHQDTSHQTTSEPTSENTPTVKDKLNSPLIQKDTITLPHDKDLSTYHKSDSKSIERNGIIHRTNDGDALCESFERTASVRSDGAVTSPSKEPVNHQRINSEPLPQSPTRRLSEGKEGTVKLQAYQKWRLSGKKGQPPTKLKISQC